MMDQRLSMVTLGVRDVAQARAFYERGLGWRASLISSTALVVFRAGSLLITLQPRGEVAADFGLDDHGPVEQFSGLGLSHAVGSREEAIMIMARAEAAGGIVTRRTAETSWGGYAGAFCDLDGYAWELVWNPDWFDDRGRVILP